MIRENGTETCTLPYAGWMTTGSSVHEAGRRGRVPCTTRRDGVRREVGGVRMGGTHVYLWPIHADVWKKPSQYYKDFTLQLNKI